jgi:hypothetical protein
MNTYFISGHLDLSPEAFNMYYKQEIDVAMKEGSHFIVGDAKGTDSMAQTYLRGCEYKNVTIYHMFDKPRNNVGFTNKGGFTNDLERDEAMTYNSTHDILWVRSVEESKKILGKKYKAGYISGTEKNRLRRQEKIKYCNK